ncbi:pantothenate kinase 1-like [Malania oleifera]|uniref:pantothenate kinase 1-like n=1 Tax=Malania oleifera TaxID=397392 RepID=UPI0025AE7F4F|nr:pantothenate kinase 1-like [Malania oleifera]
MENLKHQCEFERNGVMAHQNFHKLDPEVLLPKLPFESSLISLDIGGTLIKVVYLSRHNKRCTKGQNDILSDGDTIECHSLGGLLHVTMFETKHLNQWIEFLQTEKLFKGASLDPPPLTGYLKNITIKQGPGRVDGKQPDSLCWKATGGGAYKYADIFRDKLGITLDKVDEIASVVAGANYLLQEIDHEAFTHVCGKKTFLEIDSNTLFPYLLVNIGSGVSIIKIIGNRKFERITGTHFGGGTILGLASYDDFLELSQHGDNFALDLTVGDIYGDVGYPEHNLSPSAIASSFGKVNGSRKLSEYKVEDLAATLLRDFTYHIAQISYLVAALLGLKKIYFGGSYIRRNGFTMDNISYGLNYWSKGQMQAVFLQHEGFLGAVGALLKYKRIDADVLLPHVSTTELSCASGTEYDSRELYEGEDSLSREVQTLRAEIDILQKEKAILIEQLQAKNSSNG